MTENNFAQVMESLFKGMDAFLSAKTVIGEATKIGDIILLPLVDVSFGVGAGASAAEKKNGGGGAMTGKMSPSAVLVIKPDGSTKLVNVKNQDAITKILDMIPDVVDKITKKKQGADDLSDDDAIDAAFPENE
ncbi:MAG: GerW family sporulation protein [bacterium]|nr:GerW family sporulation protein [Clostridium sp.]MCM1536976.1 GerW family sporulation protein [bacterium]